MQVTDGEPASAGAAGYGKTVLLAGWVRRVRFPVAWLSLDAGDNDPARFWRHAVAALAARTEGWAAGLQLAGLSLRGRGDAGGFVAAFTGSHRYVLDYLAGEVLERQGGQMRSFLLETAVLEQAERAGLFVVPLDEVRGWWRYHHLFADLLRARLQQQQPARIAVLHRHAAAWYAERGLADDAIRHAVAAGEMTWAARLIEQLVDAAERAYAGTGEEPFEPTIGPAGSLLVNVLATIALVRGYLAQLRGDARGTAEFGSRAVAESRDDEWILRSVAQVQLAVAGWLDGRLDEAERAFADDIAGRRAAGLPTWRAWASYELGQVQHAQGRLDPAARTCEQALEAAARTGQPPSPAAGPAYAGLAEVAYQRNELDSALDNAERGIALCRSFVYTMPLAAGLAAQDRVGSLIEIGALRALALAACGQDSDAVDALAGALTLACPQGNVRVFADEGPPMAALLVRLIATQRGGSGFHPAASVPLGCLELSLIRR